MTSIAPPNPNSLKAGDTTPLIATLSDLNGPVNLAGCTVSMRLKSRVAGAGHATFEHACTVLQSVDGNGRIQNRGMVRYQWATGETAVAGVYGLEWIVTFADASKRTFPNDRVVTLEIVPAAS